MRKMRSLVITPFDAKGSRVADTVRRALQDLNVEVFDVAKDIRPGAMWANTITDAIRSSDFLIVDITRQNPNVLYELGFAHALRKPSILISSSEANSSPPSDLAGFQYIVYEPNDLRGLANDVQRAARVFVDRVDEQK
jgi:hypothetical protein